MPKKRCTPPKTDHLKPHQFKKGQVANPNGAGAHNPILRAIKKITQETYADILMVTMTGTGQDLEDIIKNPASSNFHKLVAKAFRTAIRDGDYSLAERFAERIIGKMPDNINVNSQNLNANLNSKVDPVLLRKALKKLDSDV